MSFLILISLIWIVLFCTTLASAIGLALVPTLGFGLALIAVSIIWSKIADIELK